MDGPMSGVNPDNVELEVGNFWRGLYKLEKGFDGIAAPKKIATKVWCLLIIDTNLPSCRFIVKKIIIESISMIA